MGYAVETGSATTPLLFLMVQGADHITPATGLSPTVTISKNGAAFATPAGAIAEIGSGWYAAAGNATDTNTLGPLVLHATASGADPTDDQYDVVTYNPLTPIIGTATDTGALSALTILTDALLELNVLAEGETPDGNLGAFGLRRLNAMIGQWATQSLTVLATGRATKVLTATTQDYTIGESGDWDRARPVSISAARIIPVGLTLELPIAVGTSRDWADVLEKAQTSTYPDSIYYDESFPLGTLHVWPVPTTAPTLVLYTPTAITGFANLSASYSFAPGYAEALYYNLAVRLATPLGRTVPDATLVMARDSLAAIKRRNQHPRELQMPAHFPGMQGVYDINTDTR